MAKMGAQMIWDGSLTLASVKVDGEGCLDINSDELDTQAVDVSDGSNIDYGEEFYKVKEEVSENNEEIGEDGEEEEYGEEGGNDVDPNFRRCGQCGELKHKKSIQRHIRLVHQNQKVSCEYCGLKLTSEDKKVIHIQKCHDLVEEVECNFCDKKFRGKALALFHETTTHKYESGNQFACEKCHKTYKTKPNLSRHIREKHKE